MRLKSIFILMSASLLFWAIGVKALPAQAAEMGGYKQYFLDQGFLGHAFSLDADDFNLRLSFGADDIPFPGVFHVLTQNVDATTSDSGLHRFGPDIRLEWTTNASENPKDVLVKISDSSCGKDPMTGCMLEETFQGKTKVIKPTVIVTGSAEARIRMGATVRLVEDKSYMSEGQASWYAYKRCPCAASPDFPKGTLVRVTKTTDPVKSVVVKINDFGPERDLFPERVIDLDKVAFAQLASTGAGVIHVKVEPLLSDDPDAIEYEEQSTVTSARTSVVTKTTTAAKLPIKEESVWEL
ncbi:MAG: septal ring lytic transglycosylase RlpA family protein [Patescibacteria group bacterium]